MEGILVMGGGVGGTSRELLLVRPETRGRGGGTFKQAWRKEMNIICVNMYL